MAQGKEEEQLAGIKMTGPEKLAKRRQQIKGAGGKKWGGGVVLEGHHHSGQNRKVERDQAQTAPFRLDDTRADVHTLRR